MLRESIAHYHCVLPYTMLAPATSQEAQTHAHDKGQEANVLEDEDLHIEARPLHRILLKLAFADSQGPELQRAVDKWMSRQRSTSKFQPSNDTR